MQDFVVPLVCGFLWICSWSIGYGIYRCKPKLSLELTLQPKGWPLTNTAAFFVEILSLTAALIAFVQVQNVHKSTPVKHFNGIVGLNISVYILLFLFLLVFTYEIKNSITTGNKTLFGTIFVVVSYNVCQLALVFLYLFVLFQHKEPIPLVLSLLVLLQKIADIYWVALRRRALHIRGT
jgi:hypothetical protein